MIAIIIGTTMYSRNLNIESIVPRGGKHPTVVALTSENLREELLPGAKKKI